MYFVAHYVKVMGSVVGAAKLFDAATVTLSGGERIQGNLIIKAVGFNVNEGSERIVGRSRVHGGNSIESGIWSVFEAHPDGNFSSSAFGSYLDSVPFVCRTLCSTGKSLSSASLRKQLDVVSSVAAARINHIKGSEAGLGNADDDDAAEVVGMMRNHVEEVESFSHNSWSPSQFLEHNRIGWIEIHRQLHSRNGARFEGQMTYAVEPVMAVVMRERPSSSRRKC